MRQYKHITFSEGISLSLLNFKKDYAPHLIGLSTAEVKEAHKIATHGNRTRANKKTPKAKTR